MFLGKDAPEANTEIKMFDNFLVEMRSDEEHYISPILSANSSSVGSLNTEKKTKFRYSEETKFQASNYK